MKIKNFAFLVLFFVQVLGISFHKTLPNSAPDNDDFALRNTQHTSVEESRLSASVSKKYINRRKKHVRTLNYPVKIAGLSDLKGLNSS
jgi:hypothetical protein